MTFTLPDNSREINAAPADTAVTSFSDRFIADRQKTALEMDSYNRLERERQTLAQEMLDEAGTDPFAENPRRASKQRNNTGFLIGSALTASEMSRDEFDAQISERLQSEYQDYTDTLATAPEGAWAAEFLGALSAGATDDSTVLTLPFGGLAGSGSKTLLQAFGRAAFLEGGLAMGAEALSLPGQAEMADTLDIAPPDPALQILMAGGIGAGLGGALGAGGFAIGRAIDYRQRRGQGDEDAPSAVEPDETTAPDARQGNQDPLPESSLGGPAELTSDLQIAEAIIQIESAGNPNARNPASSATGLGQFIDSTWLAVIKRHRPELLQGRSTAQVLDLRRDARLSREMVLAHMRDNRAYLRSQGVAIGPDTAYLAHFLGARGAANVLRLPVTARLSDVVDEAVISANRGIAFDGKPFAAFTVGDLRAWADAKMRGAPTGRAAASFTPTTRSYTGQGQVSAGDMTIDVNYEVVDISELTLARGDLQPRDRSSAASDEQIAQIAAALDPARLGPSPEADRGAPIVSAAGEVESGNGRVLALRRAATTAPDRFDAYRQQITAWGYDIPEGVETPVLVARRKSELSEPERQRFARQANDRTTAAMRPSERAMADAPRVTEATLARYEPGARLNGAENADFRRAMMDLLPQAERAGLVDKTGRLNADGLARMRATLTARAYGAPDLFEAMAATELQSFSALISALEEAAPAWAQMRAQIAAGRVPEAFDVTPEMLYAIALVLEARRVARQEGKSLDAVVGDLLERVDLLDGALDPVTAGFVRLIAPKGLPKNPEALTAFLRDYAERAGRAAAADGDLLGDAPGPGAILESLAPDAFDVPADWRGAQADAPRPVVANPPADVIALRMAGQTIVDIDDLVSRADTAQSRLDGELEAAARLVGGEFHRALPKARDTILEKVERKTLTSLNRISDAVRGAVSLQSSRDAEAMVAQLARRHEVLDEGWQMTPLGYVDRKLLVVMPDGLLAEVQLHLPGMWPVKQQADATYREMRVMPNGSEERAALEIQQMKLFDEFYATLADEDAELVLLALDGLSAPSRAKVSSNFSSLMPRVSKLARTSPASRGRQALSSGSNPTSSSPSDIAGSTPSIRKYSVTGDTSNLDLSADSPSRKSAEAVRAFEDGAQAPAADSAASLLRAEVEAFRDSLPDDMTDLRRSIDELLNEMDRDIEADEVIALCGFKGAPQ